MRILNNSSCALMHNNPDPKGRDDRFYICEVGKTLEVPDDIAEVWLKYDGVTKFIAPEDIEAEKAKAVEEALKAERAKNASKTTKKGSKK